MDAQKARARLKGVRCMKVHAKNIALGFYGFVVAVSLIAINIELNPFVYTDTIEYENGFVEHVISRKSWSVRAARIKNKETELEHEEN